MAIREKCISIQIPLVVPELKVLYTLNFCVLEAIVTDHTMVSCGGGSYPYFNHSFRFQVMKVTMVVAIV